MKKGEATGPQKRAKRPAAQQERAVGDASGPESLDEDEEAVDPHAPVERSGDAVTARRAYDSALQRISEEGQRIGLVLEDFPAGETVVVAATIPLEELADIELKLTGLRVRLSQLQGVVR